MIKLILANLVIFMLFSCFLVEEASTTNIINIKQTNSGTFIERLPDTVQKGILWFCDYEEKNFTRWEDAGTGNTYAGGGIFITDETNIEYGIETNLYYSGKASSYATIKNAVNPGQKKAVRFMRWTDKAWDKDGSYFPDKAYYSVFFYMKYAYNPAKDPTNDPNNYGGWWNVFQFKSDNNDGSQPVVALDIYNIDNRMFFALIIKDFTNDNSSDYTQEYLEQ